MSSSIENTKDRQQPIDSLVFSTFVDKFNEEYATSLTESQKITLNKYVSSFSDNGLDLKMYLNEEIGSLKIKLKDLKNQKLFNKNKDLLEKVQKVHDILDNLKQSEVDTQMLEIVLNTQNLLEEIAEHGD